MNADDEQMVRGGTKKTAKRPSIFFVDFWSIDIIKNLQ
jgi:hypothetical protein